MKMIYLLKLRWVIIKTETTVSHAKAHEAFGTALEWLEAQGDIINSGHILLVKKLRDIAARKPGISLKHASVALCLTEKLKRLFGIALIKLY